MAEPEKQPQVEVDTDDVQEKEQTVQVKEPEVPKKEKDTPNLNDGETD